MTDKEKLEKLIAEIERCERICDDFMGTHTDIIDVGISKAKKNICKHLKAFIDSLQEEPVSNDLNAELDKYIKEYFTIDKEQLDRFGLKEKDYMYSMDRSDMLILIHHFANWQKEQMMKDAIETTIIDDWQYGKDQDYTTIPAIHQRVEGCNVGEKVKIVILKDN